MIDGTISKGGRVGVGAHGVAVVAVELLGMLAYFTRDEIHGDRLANLGTGFTSGKKKLACIF